MMSEDWEIDWNLDRWKVELKRWALVPGGRDIEVRLVFRPAFGELPAVRELSVTRFPCKPVVMPWPWPGVPKNPAEVIAMARRLADEYLTQAL